jgi:ATP-binding cassette subfamily B (MDR/TAP) protein 1
LDKASISRTTIVVAHRLSTIVNTDMIVALDNGFIIEHGKHNELLEKNGVYANLVNKQMIDTVKNSNDSLKPENDTDPEILLQQERWYVRNQVEILKDEIDLKYPKTNTIVILENEKNIIDFNDNISSENVNFNTNTAYDLKLKTLKEEKDLLKKQESIYTNVS